MSRVHWLLILALAVALPAMTQESDEDGEAEVPAAAGEVAEVDNAGETDDAGEAEDASDEDASDVFDLDDPEDADLDEQTYEEDEDVFVPTEEIPSDEPIPFPTNI